MIKQVILVRKDLNMSTGKTAAQVGHAAIQFMVHHMLHNVPFEDSQIDWLFGEKLADRNFEYGGMKKVVLGVEDLSHLLSLIEFSQLLNLECHLIFDEGLDCITCGAIGPHKSSEIDVVTSHLSLL